MDIQDSRASLRINISTSDKQRCGILCKKIIPHIRLDNKRKGVYDIINKT